MSSHHLRASLFIARPIDEVFAFFSEPRNLARITPPGMGFEFRTDDFAMRDGLEIEYRLRPLLGVPATWRTRPTQRVSSPRSKDGRSERSSTWPGSARTRRSQPA